MTGSISPRLHSYPICFDEHIGNRHRFETCAKAGGFRWTPAVDYYKHLEENRGSTSMPSLIGDKPIGRIC
jgi:hypothetical protein